MSGALADLELFRSRIAAELDRLRLWSEEAEATDVLTEAARASAADMPMPEHILATEEPSRPALEPLGPPQAELAVGSSWLTEWQLSAPPAIGASPLLSESPTWLDRDGQLETEIALLLDTAPTGLGPTGLGSPGTTCALVILNAAFIPGWPFPDALVRDRLPAPQADPALAAFGAGFSTMTDAERAEYLARLGLPFQLPAQLRTLLDRALDPKVARGLLLAFLEALSALAEGLARFEEELTTHRAARERLAAAMPRHPGGKTRLVV